MLTESCLVVGTVCDGRSEDDPGQAGEREEERERETEKERTSFIGIT